MWIAVLILAAHYGVRGLVAALGVCVPALALASLAVGEDVAWMLERSTDTSEIVAFAGAVTVAWVAGGHFHRKRALSAALATRSAEAAEVQAAFGELRCVADALARRADRRQLSVTYLRSIAERIDRGDAKSGADAALELALGWTGARVGSIMVRDGANLKLFAHRGVWSADRLLPPDLFQDRTAERACSLGRPVTSAALDGVGEIESDLAVPIMGPEGDVLGVLAVRGLPFDMELAPIERHDQTIHELVAIAKWVSSSLGEVDPVPAKPQGRLVRKSERLDGFDVA
jgi:hypothetical protein